MAEYKVQLADTMDMVHTTQYGLRYPDGSIDWNYTQVGNPAYKQTVTVESLIGGKGRADALELVLAERAKAASIDLDEYRAGYAFVKRTVVVAGTEPEVIGGITTEKDLF